MVPLRLRQSALRTALSVITAAAAVALCASVLAACGGSSKTKNSSATPASSSHTTTASATAPPTAVASSGSSISETCPPASVVNAALGQNDSAPVSTSQTYGITCTYKGTGVVSTKIQFQQDTAATFTAGEDNVAASGQTPTTVSGVGDQAYVVGGFIAVLKGSIAVKITSPLSSAAQVEALAHQIVG